jgi:hypothetical protein
MQRELSVFKKSKFTLMSGIALSAIAFLSACEYIDGEFTPKNERSYVASAANTSPEQAENAQGYANTKNNMNGALGVTTRAYLTKEVQDSIYSLARLHQSVSDMQSRLNVVAPSAQQLEMMKDEINTLGKKFDQIQMSLREGMPENVAPAQTQSQNGMMQNNQANWQNQNTMGRPMNIIKADPAMSTPMTYNPAVATGYNPAPATFASQVPAGTTGLVDVRVGEHSGKTRLVLDMAQATDIRYDLDNEQNILVVELPGAAANGLTSKTFPKSPLLKGYDVQQSGENTLVIFMFKKPTRIVENMQLKGTGKSATRYVFDMAK